jgi:large subunit ribosomal protein L31
MKKGIHPESYRFVVFKDMKLEISSSSHPFFTGQKVLVDTAGRIDKFKKRYEKKK